MRKGSALQISGAVLCSLLCTAAPAQQDYPNKPIRVVLPIAPGSGSDREGRVLMNKLSESLRQPVVMDFRPGASSLIGMNHVARSAPDGYTFLLMSAAFSMVPLMEGDIPFDRLNAFAPVSLLTKRWTVMAVSPSMPSTAADFVAYGKANPGVINFGTGGAGKGQHLTGAWMQSITAVNMAFIHYKGGAQAHTDLLGGRIHITPMILSTAAPYLKAGKLKVIGLSNLSRHPGYPDIPTLHEQGWTDFEYVSWMGLSAPAKIPPAVLTRVNSELSKAVKAPDVVKVLGGESQLVGNTPDEFRRVVTAETARWRRLLKEYNIKLETD